MEDQDDISEEGICDPYIHMSKQISSEHLIGNSDKMKELMANLILVAPSDASVLLEGETGTGKTKVAKLIHYHSRREKEPFVNIFCGAIPETMIESELFGHEKGAFTGADKTRIGYFEYANKGTVFLDEIGELSLSIQTKLLRVLDEKEFVRLGSTKVIKTDIRLISATNKNLKEQVNQGKFREDLYYRIMIVSLKVPSLRERTEDIPPLIDYFINFYKNINQMDVTISPSALDLLKQYKWPGNIRELRNCIQRTLVFTKKDEKEILPIHLPEYISNSNNALCPPGCTHEEFGKALDLLENLENIAKVSTKLTQEEVAKSWNCSKPNVSFKIKKSKGVISEVFKSNPNLFPYSREAINRWSRNKA